MTKLAEETIMPLSVAGMPTLVYVNGSTVPISNSRLARLYVEQTTIGLYAHQLGAWVSGTIQGMYLESGVSKGEVATHHIVKFYVPRLQDIIEVFVRTVE
jgi:hypothetical protein